VVVLWSAVAVAVGGCSSTPASPQPAPIGARLEPVITLDRPVAMASRAGDEELYVAEQGGVVVAFRDDEPGRRVVLDLTDETEGTGEQGLLGLAFSPDGRRLYVNFTDLAGDTHIVEYAMRGGRADPGSARQLLRVDQPFANHNGGDLAFGPDGFLYIGLGDGGGAGDPFGNGQSLQTLLGKMLRIDPRPSGGAPYTVPASNPFVGRPGARPEIWAYGLRNPWRFSFDRETGDLWIADVGQSSLEEIDRQPASSGGGENYGWNAFEGTVPFSGSPSSEEVVEPVFEYDHIGGVCAVAGGYVYRGSAIPALDGAYLFADVCVGQVTWLRLTDDGVEHDTIGTPLGGPAAFGKDAAGELYVLTLEGPVYRLVPA
jgi:glucose/arabinose dehydrogenase